MLLGIVRLCCVFAWFRDSPQYLLARLAPFCSYHTLSGSVLFILSASPSDSGLDDGELVNTIPNSSNLSFRLRSFLELSLWSLCKFVTPFLSAEPTIFRHKSGTLLQFSLILTTTCRWDVSMNVRKYRFSPNVCMLTGPHRSVWIVRLVHLPITFSAYGCFVAFDVAEISHFLCSTSSSTAIQ